jgi:hypothetical protein
VIWNRSLTFQVSLPNSAALVFLKPIVLRAVRPFSVAGFFPPVLVGLSRNALAAGPWT